MIQSVVEPSAFKIAHQYFSESRVRIVEADENEISSVVIGNSGVYEQTIRLRDGALTTKCACPLNEQPLCRHAIAVLLEYHQWARPKESQRPQPAEPNVGSVSDSTPATSGPDVKFNEVAIFLDWLQATVSAIERGHPIPAGPRLSQGEAVKWVRTVLRLEEQRRENQEKVAALEADLREREAQLHRLTQQIQASKADLKAAQAACEELRREVAEHAGMQAKLSEITKELDRIDNEMKSMAGDFVRQTSQLDGLANSVKGVSAALHALAQKADTSRA